MPARISHESARGCGYRKVGGLYLCCDPVGMPCGKLPLELCSCPTCGGGFHATRSWTWIDPRPIFEKVECALQRCDYCPVGAATLPSIERCGLLWVGTSFYPTPDDFTREVQEMGVSRRVPAVPKGFEIGKTWAAIAHRHCFEDTCSRCQSSGKVVGTDGIEKCEECKGKGKTYRGGIFHFFKPSRIEKVVDEDITEEEIEKLEKRGIEAVIVKEAETVEV